MSALVVAVASPLCGKELQQRRRSLAPLRDHSWCRSFFIARRRSSRKVSSYLSGRSSLCCTSSPFVQLVKPCVLSPNEESLARLPIIVFGNEDASCGAVEAYVPAGPAWNAAAARVRMLEPKGTTLDRNRDFVELPLRRLARQAWVVRSVGGRR